MGFRETRHTSGVRKYWPVIGFLMIVAVAILSWFLAPAAIDAARDIVPRFTGRELSPTAMRIAFTVLLTVILGSLSAMLLALASPKRKDVVREGDMLREREQLLNRKAVQRERQRKVNRELRGK